MTEDAASLIAESLRISYELEDRLQAILSLGRLAAVLVNHGRPQDAVRLVAASEALTRQLGSETPWWAARRNEETLVLARSRLDEDSFDERVKQGGALSLDEAVALALDTPT
jgi:hypothetical protein